jgi:prepilin-type processing-associated H-X9-DG protein
MGGSYFGYTTNMYPHGGDTEGNFAFADGHAKAVKWDMTCTYIDPWWGAYCLTVDNMYTFLIDGP